MTLHYQGFIDIQLQFTIVHWNRFFLDRVEATWRCSEKIEAASSRRTAHKMFNCNVGLARPLLDAAATKNMALTLSLVHQPLLQARQHKRLLSWEIDAWEKHAESLGNNLILYRGNPSLFFWPKNTNELPAASCDF